jgi:hypothetical protein
MGARMTNGGSVVKGSVLGVALVLLAGLAAGCTAGGTNGSATTAGSLAAATTSFTTATTVSPTTTAPVTTSTAAAATTTAQTGSTGTTAPDPGLYPVRQGFTAGYIDRSGKMAIPATYAAAADFSEGLAAVEVGDKWGFIDTTGKVALPAKWDDAYGFSDGLAAVKVGEKYGFIDKHGAMVLPAKYPSASSFSEGLASVALPEKEGGGWVFIDHSGKVVIKGDFVYLGSFSEGLADAYVAAPGDQPGTMSEWGFIDTSGKWVIGPKTGGVITPGSTPGPFSEGLASAGQDSGIGYIDKTGKFVIPAEYEDAAPFSEGLAPVEQGEKWGYIDKTGTLVIPYQYRTASPFAWGLAMVTDEHGLWSYIDTTGTSIWHETVVIPLSAEKRKELDSLDAAGVLRAFYATSDPWVQYYLYGPRDRDSMMSNYYADWVPHPEKTAHLKISGPSQGSVDPGVYSPTDWPIQEDFTVEYDLLSAPPDWPEEPGPQQLFATVGRQSPTSPWRILEIGTGP